MRTYDKFTIKEKKLISEVIHGNHKNHRDRGIASGYSPASAHSVVSETLQKPEIRAEIERRLERRMKEAGVTFEDNVKVLKKLQDKCLAERDKEIYPDDKFHPQAVIGATDLLNKMGNFYKDDNESKTEVSVRLPELVKKYERDA